MLAELARKLASIAGMGWGWGGCGGVWGRGVEGDAKGVWRGMGRGGCIDDSRVT